MLGPAQLSRDVEQHRRLVPGVHLRPVRVMVTQSCPSCHWLSWEACKMAAPASVAHPVAQTQIVQVICHCGSLVGKDVLTVSLPGLVEAPGWCSLHRPGPPVFPGIHRL